MRFTKNSRLKEKFIEIASKAALLAITTLFCLWMISGARAATPQIADLSVRDDGGTTHVELKLTETIPQDHLAVEFQRNFIQLSFTGVSAFPAKNKNVQNGTLDKIFTYQYQPDLARARLLLKGDASKVKAKTTWRLDGNVAVVEIQHGAASPAVTAKSSRQDKVQQRAAATEEHATAAATEAQAAEDKIVNEILNETKEGKNPAPAANAAKATKAQAAPAASEESIPLGVSERSERKVAASGATPSPIQRVISSLLTVLVIMAALALAFRKFVMGKGVKFNGFHLGGLGHFGGRQNRLIEVISTQSLAPKKSVAVVRVADQYLVLGLSGENVTLLTNLDAKANIEKYIDQNDEADQSFAGALGRSMDKDDEPMVANRNAVFQGSGIRASIKKRIEGFKPL